MSASRHLTEWIVDFIKNRDLIYRKVESIEIGKDGFDAYVKFKDKEQYILCYPTLDNVAEMLARINSEGHFAIVTLNTEENFNSLVKNWGEFSRYKKLSIYFVNPFSKLDKKWIIFPHTHNNICEQEALSKGIRTMFEMVEPLSEADIKEKLC